MLSQWAQWATQEADRHDKLAKASTRREDTAEHYGRVVGLLYAVALDPAEDDETATLDALRRAARLVGFSTHYRGESLRRFVFGIQLGREAAGAVKAALDDGTAAAWTDTTDDAAEDEGVARAAAG